MTLSADEVVQVQFTPKGFTDTIEITGYNYIVEDSSVNVDLKNNEIEIYENDKYLENSKNYEVMSINKINNKKYKNKFADKLLSDALEFLEEEPTNETYKVVKKKTFELDPMSVEDAEAYMEAVGHSFYVFLNAETGEINVLYKRNDGNLGLIEAIK